MLDICLLGTSGMMPLPNRWLTSLMMRYNGTSILIDSGEGTQVAIKEKGWSVNPIDVICITHYHADHISGLPGLLLSMGNADKTSPLTMIGPKGLERVVNSLRVIAPELPFQINFIELTEEFRTIEFEGYSIEAFKANHAIACYGYNMVIKRNGRFDPAKAKDNDVPMKYWSKLQKGEVIKEDGRVFTQDMILGPKRKGIKVSYCTDSRPTNNIITSVSNADLFICEGMYGEDEKFSKAKEHKHMMFSEAASMAKEAQVAELWLTHYSPSLVRPDEYIDVARSIFKESKAARDGWSKTFVFEEE